MDFVEATTATMSAAATATAGAGAGHHEVLLRTPAVSSSLSRPSPKQTPAKPKRKRRRRSPHPTTFSSSSSSSPFSSSAPLRPSPPAQDYCPECARMSAVATLTSATAKAKARSDFGGAIEGTDLAFKDEVRKRFFNLLKSSEKNHIFRELNSGKKV